MAIRGMNFSYQQVRPEDDGRLYENILKDGILSGCALSSAGATLALATGYIMMCGRLIRINFATLFDLSQETSGFARVLLQIDLSGTATESEFSQVSAIIQYAASEAAFAELTQDDINSGAETGIYQQQLALCSLSVSGIASILKSMPAISFV